MTTEIGRIASVGGSELLRVWQVSVDHMKRALRTHSHMQFEICLVKSGSGEYTTDRAVYPMTQGDVFVFSSNEQHCITDIHEEGLEIINIHFMPEYIWGRSFDSVSDESINLCFSHSESFSNRIPHAESAKLASYISEIANEMRSRQAEYHLVCKSVINLMLISLIRDFSYNDKKITAKGDQIRSIRLVISYIDAHFQEKLTLSMLSSVAGMSPNYLSSLFRDISGVTLWNYVSQKRVEAVAKRITASQNDETMLEAALKCGFNNTANFNKAFKRHMGMTPGEYINSDHFQ